MNLIDLTEELNTPAVLSRHYFLTPLPAIPMQLIVEDDGGDFCVPMNESAACNDDDGDFCVPMKESAA